MIKLNNKNITYVALADSNNSLKAPKEIWYADSANSVKLVYRRKDALIEGEDYKKYHWLQGRNGAYIDTNYYPIVGTDIFSVHFYYDGTLRNPDGTEQDAFGASGTNLSSGRISVYINGENYLSCNYGKVSNDYFPSTHKHSLDWNVSNLRIDGENFKYDANNDSYSFSNKEIPTVTGNRTLYVFSCNQSANTYLHGDISSFKITDTSSNTKMNLIPCKLLRPIPKWLDANGIRRQVGECGMIDLVSDRFYGNVANSGTFKAVNLAEGVDYEVHDWLVAEIPIRTSMRSLPINSANFSFTAIFGQKANITILKGDTHEYYVYDNNMQTIRVWGYGIGNVYESDVLSNTMIVESTSAELLVNNIAIPQYGYPIKYLMFSSSSNSPNNTTLRVSKVYIDGIERYIPIKLLKSIPAKYDANGIARQVGECGMYDTVNDVFYGNVASSGTFSVSDDS